MTLQKSFKTLIGWKPLLIIALAFSSAIQAQPNSPLKVELHSNSVRVHGRSLLTLNVILRNTDSHRVVVLRGEPGFAEAGGLELVIVDQQGANQPARASLGILSLEEARDGAQHVKLAPGHGLGLHRRDRVSDLFPKPGRYHVLVNYRSPTPSIGNRSVSSGAVEGSQATSNTIEIDVLD